ncbi:MAG: SDR family oxidoreductase [Clostridia bacterium]|nr:SDR family oxidoreductase [Clostridia bacterium]
MKTVVITGSTRGLGFEMAKKFRGNDFNVVVCGTNDAGIEKAVGELNGVSGKGELLGIKCNVSNSDEVEALCHEASDKFGNIDIWINNAGVNQSFKYAWELDSSEMDFLFGVDLKGTINGTNVAVRHMTKQGFGAIYNVEGMGSNDAIQCKFALYGTAKRAVTYYTDAIAKELTEANIPIIIGKLSPGIMITDFLTSSKGQKNAYKLEEKTKKVYNILGDYPDVIAGYLVTRIIANKKTNCRIEWLTNRKAAWRFMTAGVNKRDFFDS